MATAIRPSSTRTIASWRCFLRMSGVSANVAAMVSRGASALRGPLDDQIGDQIHRESDAEEQDADHEQHLVVVRPDRGLAELGGDRRRERAHGIERAMRDVYGVTRG